MLWFSHCTRCAELRIKKVSLALRTQLGNQLNYCQNSYVSFKNTFQRAFTIFLVCYCGCTCKSLDLIRLWVNTMALQKEGLLYIKCNLAGASWWGMHVDYRVNCLQSAVRFELSMWFLHLTHTETILAQIEQRQIPSGPYLLQAALLAIGFNSYQ